MTVSSLEPCGPRLQRPRSRLWMESLAWLLVAVVIVAVVWRFRVVGDATVLDPNHDAFIYHYPMYAFTFGTLRAGELPLWNPHQLNGVPALATMQAGTFYPPHLVYLLAPTALGMGIMAFTHLLLAILFAAWFGHSLGLSQPGAWICGLAFGLSSPLLSQIGWPPLFESMVWLPFMLAGTERLMSRNDRRWLSVIAIGMALSLYAGGAQMAMYGACATASYAALRGCAAAWRARSTEFLKRAALGLAALAVGVALAAPQVLPTLELSAERSDARTLLPEQLRLLPPLSPAAMAHAAILPPREFSWLYLGAVPIALASVGVAAVGSRLHPAGVITWAVLISACGLLAGMGVPWFLKLHTWLPVLGWFRVPERALFLASMGLATLAGLGFDALQGRRAERSSRRIWAVLLGVAAALAVVRFPTGSWTLPVALVGLAWAARPGRWFAPFLGSAVCAVLMFDLVGYSTNRTTLPYVNETWRRILEHRPVLDVAAERAGLDRVLLLGESNQSWFMKLPMLTGSYSPVDYDSLTLRRYGDFFAFGDLGRLWDSDWPFFYGTLFANPFPERPQARRLYRLLSTRYYVLSPEARGGPHAERLTEGLRPLDVPSWEADPRTRGFGLFEDPEALPRAYAVYQARCIEGIWGQLIHLTSSQFDPRRAVILDGDCGVQGVERSRMPPVEIEEYLPTRVRMRVNMSRAGFLVLTDSFYSGWRAEVNGRPEPVLRANVVLRAVPVPRGDSRVELYYAPRSLYLGGMIFAAVLGGGGLWVLRARLQGRTSALP